MTLFILKILVLFKTYHIFVYYASTHVQVMFI